MEKKISIALTTYNGDRFLREQLDSIYSQTRKPDEVVVFDDCSKDETVIILKEYQKRFGLIYHVNSSNIGFNANFERAILATKGDYVMLCDQDDVWFYNKVDTLLEAIKEKEKPNCPCVVCSNVINVNEELVPYKRFTTIHNKPRDWKYNLHGGFTQGCILIMNRIAVEKIMPLPKEFIFDAYIGLSINMIGQWYNIGKPLMYYRHHKNNVIGKSRSKQKILFLEKFSSTDPIPFIIGSQRIELMKYIYQRFKDEMVPYKLALFNTIITYPTKNKLYKIFIILNNPCARLRQKIKSIIALFVS